MRLATLRSVLAQNACMAWPSQRKRSRLCVRPHLAAALVATERALYLCGGLVKHLLLQGVLAVDGGAEVPLVIQVCQRQVARPDNARFVGVVLQQPVREPRERAGGVVRGLFARQRG